MEEQALTEIIANPFGSTFRNNEKFNKTQQKTWVLNLKNVCTARNCINRPKILNGKKNVWNSILLRIYLKICKQIMHQYIYIYFKIPLEKMDQI